MVPIDSSGACGEEYVRRGGKHRRYATGPKCRGMDNVQNTVSKGSRTAVVHAASQDCQDGCSVLSVRSMDFAA
ncbi:hypothetical protein K0M31_011965 [Melipona bicolor]|uniref:Uncharacterized protein n=1 Tax=Melipona bicolor TaxID=60889 RepID=A0AA40KV81_9HYME|nr:hypothetical protein K0M31_011965 [Melipona bicolor]